MVHARIQMVAGTGVSGGTLLNERPHGMKLVTMKEHQGTAITPE
jgi:hypothetical protein